MSELTFGQMREEAKKQGFEPIPIGTYNFKIETANLKNGNAGMPQIMIKIVVMDGPLAGQNTITRLVFYKNDGDVNGMVFRQLKSLGIGDDHPVWAQIDAVGLEQGIGSLSQLVVGATFIGDIDHNEWNGETRDNLKNMKPYGSGGIGAAPPIGAGVPTGPPVAPVAPVAPVPVAAPVAVPPAPTPVATPAPVAPVPQAAATEVAQTPVPVAPQPMEAVTTAPVPVAEPVPVAAPVAPAPVPVPPPPPEDPF